MPKAKIGVLAVQGDFQEHCRMLEQCGASTELIKSIPKEGFSDLDGLILPGGETTTFQKFDQAAGAEISGKLSELGRSGVPIYGTCMGSILLASSIEGQSGNSLGLLGLMDITVRRNAYGPQKNSFETELSIPCLGDEPYRTVFIRAPKIISWGKAVQVLAELEGSAVLARQGNFLASTFHPELTGDTRVHRYFLSMIKEK